MQRTAKCLKHTPVDTHTRSPLAFGAKSLRPNLLALAVAHAISAPVFAASIEVNANHDAGAAGTCTLRQAIISANDNSAGVSNCVPGAGATDTITFANSGLITLSSPLTPLSSNMTINGPNNSDLTIDANSTGIVFDIQTATVSLNDMTISGGSAGSGGGVYANASDVTLSNVTVTDNSADYGAGILAFASNVSVNNSTVSGNSAVFYGGGIYTDSGSVNLSNSTVTGNSADAGGGIYTGSTSTVSLANSTISGNSAYYGGGVYTGSTSSVNLINGTLSGNSANYGGGIYAGSASTVDLNNNIIAGNRADTGAEVFNLSAYFTTGYNLFGDSDTEFAAAFDGFAPNDITDITATISGIQETALADILGPLADNGGATHTHALVLGSPALNNANTAICAAAPISSLDQRGIARGIENCDIGAVEDRRKISVVVTDANKDEGDDGTTDFNFTISRIAPATGAASVNYSVVGAGENPATANDFGGTLPSGLVSFTDSEISKVVSISVSGDRRSEADEQFSVVLSNAVDTTITAGEASGTIINDDGSPSLFVVPLSNGKAVIFDL
jgi:hypothetical protein